MTANPEHRILQLFYTGVLADSVKNYHQAGIPGKVTAERATLQKKPQP